MPESIKPARRHVVFFPSPIVPAANRAKARRRLHRQVMQRRLRQKLARLRPFALASLLAFAPPIGLMLLWAGRMTDGDARVLLTCLTALNVCGQLALMTMLKA